MTSLKKTRLLLRYWWSSYSNGLIFCWITVLILIWNSRVEAVTVSAVYSSACVRETGVIVNVDDNTLQLISLDGVIHRIPRFNIIYMARYPIGRIRIPQVVNPGETEFITVKTVFEDDIVDLVKGWMIDYSEEQISFLTLAGTQSVIDTDDIWDITIDPFEVQTRHQALPESNLHFVHPYPFMHCEPEGADKLAGNDQIHKVYPQYLLSEPLLIKKELDRLKEGYDIIRKYNSNRRFYPVPQVYGNDTSLGLWVNYGNRYGSSNNRSNSFIPAIVNETTDGPFGYQSIFITGSAPMFYSFHEEPQMQAYFRMKASYLHFSIMLDFSRFTMGSEKYKWSEEDLEENDNRENEILHLAGGFDYGPFAFDISVIDILYYAVQHESRFHQDDMNLNRGSLSFHNRYLKAELHFGVGQDTKEPLLPLPDDVSGPEREYIEAYNEELRKKADFQANFTYYRFTLDLFGFASFRPTYSLIYKEMDFTREKDGDGLGEFVYLGKSLTNAVHVAYSLNEELTLSGYLSMELMEKQYGLTEPDDKSSHTYPKGGVSLALLF